MTLTELRARLRAELGDEAAGAYVWTDALLDGFLGDATERLGEDVPAERSVELSPGADGSYVLPGDLVRLRAVESGGVRLLPSEYTVWAGRLTLAVPTSGTLNVRYAAARSRPPATGDAGLGAGEEVPVVWLAAAYKIEWLAKQREKDGVGSHFLPSAAGAVYRDQYDRWLQARRRRLNRVSAG